jgi:hypothetical protein
MAYQCDDSTISARPGFLTRAWNNAYLIFLQNTAAHVFRPGDDPHPVPAAQAATAGEHSIPAEGGGCAARAAGERGDPPAASDALPADDANLVLTGGAVPITVVAPPGAREGRPDDGGDENAGGQTYSPLKLMVDLGKTHVDPLLEGCCGIDNLQAQPPMTLREVQELSQSQRFDVTALVARVDDNPREIPASRRVINVQLLDASGPGGKAQEVTFGFFYDHPPSGADLATIGILCHKSGEALSFFGLQSRRVDGGFSLRNSKDFFVVEAVGERAAQLEATADALDLKMHRPTRKRGAPWSDALSPADAKKCRVLGRSSAEGPLDEA